MDVGEGFVGFVVMDRTVFFVVMVVDALFVHEFMRHRFAAIGLRQAALHGKTIQGHTQQQEKVDEAAQEGIPKNAPIIAASRLAGYAGRSAKTAA